ncbi:MAG: DUF4252 domain-containing protein [Bryobacteraceae bacterium]|nr:DUF4252 domain-containing protein [Bryobacteraceae bacterium]
MKRCVFLLALAPLCAQDIKFPPGFTKLADRADKVVDITLDASSLGLAGRFLSEKKDEESRAKRLIGGLKGIYVRSFEFAREGEYSDADVEEIRSQLRTPEWSPVVSVRSRKRTADNAEIFVKKEGGRMAGLTVLASEPTKLTVVHILGSIDIDDLGELGRNLGLPDVRVSPDDKKPAEKIN